MNSSRENIRATVLDRLIDEDPGTSREPAQHRLVSVGKIKSALVRDLEQLLNTRRTIVDPPSICKQVNTSVFVYGLRDFSVHNPNSPAVRQALRQDIERAITQFEPRLKNVIVELEANIGQQRNLRFRITGMLVIDPVAEPVTFDTFFDLNRGEYFISR